MLVRRIIILLISKGMDGRSKTTLVSIQGILTQEAGRAGERGCCLHLSNVCSSDNSYGSGGFGVLLKARKKFLAPADELHNRQQVGRMEQLSISCHDGETSSSPLLKGQQLQPAGPRATSCGCGHLGFGSL